MLNNSSALYKVTLTEYYENKASISNSKWNHITQTLYNIGFGLMRKLLMFYIIIAFKYSLWDKQFDFLKSEGWISKMKSILFHIWCLILDVSDIYLKVLEV